MFTDLSTQSFLRDGEFIGDAGDCSVGSVGIGLGMKNKFHGPLFELVGVFDGLARVSFSNFLPTIKPGAEPVNGNPGCPVASSLGTLMIAGQLNHDLA